MTAPLTRGAFGGGWIKKVGQEGETSCPLGDLTGLGIIGQVTKTVLSFWSRNIAMYMFLCYNLNKKQVIILTDMECKFDELIFFAQVKKRPGLFLGKPSLLSFRDQLFGMEYAFSFYNKNSPLKYFHLFIEWYHVNILKDSNGYACWWNHILYISGNNDAYALESFFNTFERYLRDMHNVSLPEVK